MATVAAAGGGTALWLSQGSSREPDFGGITCSQVQALAPAYQKGELSEAERERVHQHLAQCPRCGPRFKAMGLRT
jgi:hypothetical protein